MCSQFLIARLRVVKGVLNLETICDCGSEDLQENGGMPMWSRL